jgi:predicted XRE-type DNA-binding protein
MTIEVFESVWDALEDTPTEAENMKLRSSLMIAISGAVSGWNVTQTEAAGRLGVTQPRLNDLLRGRVGKFSIDALVLRRRQTIHSTVLAGLGPAIHETRHKPYRFSWMPGTRPGKTIWVRVNHLSASEH